MTTPRAGSLLVAVDDHPTCDGIILTVQDGRERRYVEIVRSESSASLIVADLRPGSRVLRMIADPSKERSE